MNAREIVAAFQEMYGADISAGLVSKVMKSVLGSVIEWQGRPLGAVYSIVLKIRKDKRAINKAVHLALGVNLEGYKEFLGFWIFETEGGKFWLGLLIELKNRGVEEILIVCVNGLSGFPKGPNSAVHSSNDSKFVP